MKIKVNICFIFTFCYFQVYSLKLLQNSGLVTNEVDSLIGQNNNNLTSFLPTDYNQYGSDENSNLISSYNTLLNQIYLKKQILLQKYNEAKNDVSSNVANDKQNNKFNLKEKEKTNLTKNNINKTEENKVENKQSKEIEQLINATIAINKNMQENYNTLLKEVLELKQENLELKKQSLEIQNDLKPFLKSILDMQLYSFNNLNTYKTTINKIAEGMNDYKKEFIKDIIKIKDYLNQTMTRNKEEKIKENVFSETLKEKNDENKATNIKLSLKKNGEKSDKKESSFLDP